MTLQSEIFEQPERLAALLANQRHTAEKIAQTIHRSRHPLGFPGCPRHIR